MANLSRAQLGAIREEDKQKGVTTPPKTHIGAMLGMPKGGMKVETPSASRFQFHGPKPIKPFSIKRRSYYGENKL